MKLLIYTTFRTNRLIYISNFIFQDLLGLKVELTSNKTYFIHSNAAKINYSIEDFEITAVKIVPHSLLQTSKIESQKILIRYKDSIPYFFHTSEQADISSDLLAASFYLISRYEEYLDFEADVHGRFPAHQSLAYRAGFLETPLINQWTIQLKKILQTTFPDLVFQLPNYQFQPTFDIDLAWAYRHKSLKRTLGASFRDLSKGQFGSCFNRFLVLLGFKADPYDIYEYLNKLHESSNPKPIFFFLLGDYGIHDKNIHPDHPKLKGLIQDLNQQNPVAIHPSYASNTDIWQLRKEIKRLEAITHRTVSRSRQHYLKLHLPSTYQNLIKSGIEQDYSMGYADQIGFRASVAQAFFWYDLKQDAITELKIHPFQVMDVTLKSYMTLSPEIAQKKIVDLIKITRKYGGTFCSLWHNSSFSTIGDWEEWKRVYEQMLKA